MTMETLDFYCCNVSDAPIHLNEGQYTNRTYTKTYFYQDFTEFMVRDGDVVFFYYCYHPNSSQTTFFLFPSEQMSEMFSEIMRFIDQWNFPSVQEQWPHFAKAYKNGEDEGFDKIMLKKIPNWEKRGEEDVVFMVTLNKYIPFEPTYGYRELIYKLVKFANDTIEEVLDDNGCLNVKGMVKSFLRGAKDGSFWGRIFGLFS